MGCPDAVDRALEGLAGVERVEWDYAEDVVYVHVRRGGADAATLHAKIESVMDGAFQATAVAAALAGDEPAQAGGEPLAQPAGHEWPERVTRALAAAADAGHSLVLVSFGADWCPPCQRLKHETLADPAVEAFLSRHVQLVEVDAEVEPGVLTSFNVASLPELHVLTLDGEHATYVRGFRSAEQLLSLLRAKLPR